MRRVRASLLLHSVLLAGGVALALCFHWLSELGGWPPGTVVLVVVLWLVSLCGLLPWVMERSAVRRAARSEGPVRSIWFVDLDERDRRRMQQLHDDTRDNPTLR
jgi:hypothetical protein